MHYLLSIYHALPAGIWGIVFGTPFVVGVVNLAKKLLKSKTTLVIHLMTSAVSALLAALPVILNHPETLKVFGLYSGAFFTAANITYSAVKAAAPVINRIQAYSATKKTLSAQPTAADITTAPTYEG